MTPLASWGVLIAWVLLGTSLLVGVAAGLDCALNRIKRLMDRDKGEYRD